MAVTGNVLPLELETPAQWFYELYGGLGRGFERRDFDRAWFRSSGGGADVEPRRDRQRRLPRRRPPRPAIGLMDEALGPGMPSGVGEDTYLFYRSSRRATASSTSPRVGLAPPSPRHARAPPPDVRLRKGHVAYLLTTWLRDGARALSASRLLPRWHVRQLERWACTCGARPTRCR